MGPAAAADCAAGKSGCHDSHRGQIHKLEQGLKAERWAIIYGYA